MSIGVCENQDIRKFVVWIDRLELLRGIVNAISQSIVDWIVPKPSHDLQRLGIRQLFIQPFVILDVLRLAIEDELSTLEDTKIGSLALPHLQLREPFCSQAMPR